MYAIAAPARIKIIAVITTAIVQLRLLPHGLLSHGLLQNVLFDLFLFFSNSKTLSILKSKDYLLYYSYEMCYLTGYYIV